MKDNDNKQENIESSATNVSTTMKKKHGGIYTRGCDSKRIQGIDVYKAKLSVGVGVGTTTKKSTTPVSDKVSSSSAVSKVVSFMKFPFPSIGTIRLYTVVFILLYMYQTIIVIRSMGTPYYEFLIKADEEGFNVMIGSVQAKAELQHQMKSLNNINRRTTKLAWTDWIDYDIEELAIEKKRDREKSVLDSLPKHMRVPGKYQSSFWPTLVLGILFVVHSLLLLLQHWSTRFNIWINYEEMNINTVVTIMNQSMPLINLQTYISTTTTTTTTTNSTNNAETVTPEIGDPIQSSSSSTTVLTAATAPTVCKYKKDANGNYIVFPDRELTIPTHVQGTVPTHARIIPSKIGEKSVLVPIHYMPGLGMTVEYHRRKYIYNVDEQVWVKVRCRTNFSVNILTKWIGFRTYEQLIAGQIRFGPNLFQVKQPQFFDLYKAQLLNPFSVFQIFCVLLWAIDDYITYSLFSLFMVLLFEGTVVLQRIKSLQALQSMGNPSRLVYVYRSSIWISIDSAQLLPGDIISLTRVRPHRAKVPVAVPTTATASATASATAIEQQKDTTTTTTTPKQPIKTITKIEDDGGDVVPADLLLLRGSTVVNEASLTGESVPQMKEGITDIYDPLLLVNNNNNNNTSYDLSMKIRHKMNVVYAGTKMLQCSGCATTTTNTETNDETSSSTTAATETTTLFSHIPVPPDNGCICFVLRTGFASAQGKLVRMIEGSQEKVKGHERETGMLLGLLCIFAIISSSYVLYHGMQDSKRSKYELLLHCILIVTNVIRPELPMQMALAVNNSLMTLMKLHVFCTEPYRVPMAGKLTSCLFDKTGTLTTDELVATGVCQPNQLITNTTISSTSTVVDETKLVMPLQQILNSHAALVLAGCQSLVVFDDETTGDPLESSSLRAMKWQISITSGNAEPIPERTNRPGGKPITITTTNSSGIQQQQSIKEVRVLTRHHFSSKLQRMSCVIRAVPSNVTFSVAKGSPEAVGNLLGTKPSGYDNTAEYLSKQGYRVIALAYKVLATADDIAKSIETRAECEKQLHFAGFIAFTCMVRKDTADILKRLREGGMSVAMITGDALLTAIHVAKEVDIVNSSTASSSSSASSSAVADIDPELAKNPELYQFISEIRGKQNGSKQQLLPKRSSNDRKNNKADAKPIAYLSIKSNDTTDTSTGTLYWRSYTNGEPIEDYVASEVPHLSTQYDLAMTGKCLAQALSDDKHTSKVLGYIKVFARMTPDAKETVIESLHSVRDVCLMCGDGANDVGALKQADVGVALLSGFGNINVAKVPLTPEEEAAEEAAKKKKATTDPPVTAIISQDHLNQIRALPVALIKMKIKQLGTDPNKYPEIIEKEDLIKLYQIKAREVAIKRHDEKNAIDKKNMTKKEQQLETKRLAEDKQRRLMARIAELEAQGVSFASFKAMKEFASAEMQQVKARQGDASSNGVEGSAASIAAQFEASMGGGSNGTDALEDMGLPMIKLGDASIAAPFTSKMPSIRSCVDIVRQGRCTLVSSMQMYQIMALQCLISSYALSVLYLEGIKYGDTQMTALGILGTVSHLSISRSKPLDKLSRVKPLSSIFHPASFFSLLGQFAIHLLTMVLAVRGAKDNLEVDWKVDLDGEFKPGLLNTVVFLITSVQQVTVFFVNLQGRPFMTGVTENRPLLWSMIMTFVLTFMFASESVPGLNRYFQLVPFPNDQFRDYILIILGIDLVATLAFDRFMKFIFARDILRASIEETTMKDVWSLVRTFGTLSFLMVFFLGNSDTWDQLLAIEEAQRNGTYDFGTGKIVATTVTNVSEATVESLINTTFENISAIANVTNTVIHDEF